jgi:hypothetical protein
MTGAGVAHNGPQTWEKGLWAILPGLKIRVVLIRQKR